MAIYLRHRNVIKKKCLKEAKVQWEKILISECCNNRPLTINQPIVAKIRNSIDNCLDAPGLSNRHPLIWLMIYDEVFYLLLVIMFGGD